MRHISIAFFLITLALVPGIPSLAEEKPRTASEPAELSARRAEHIRAMQRASVPLLTNYLRQVEFLKDQFTRRSDLPGAQAADAEIQRVKEQLAAATATSQGARNAVVLPVEITSARWQAADPKLFTDVTAHLKKVMESGTASVTVNTMEAAGGADPARGKSKSLVLEYSVNGKVKQKTFPEGERLTFGDLK